MGHQVRDKPFLSTLDLGEPQNADGQGSSVDLTRELWVQFVWRWGERGISPRIK